MGSTVVRECLMVVMEIGRNPDGPRDGSVQVVSVLIPRVKTTARRERHGWRRSSIMPAMALYSGQITCWFPRTGLGQCGRKLKSELGGVTLFLQGATADINPDMYWEDSRAFEMVEEQGLRVADAVLAAITSGSTELPGAPLQIEAFRSLAADRNRSNNLPPAEELWQTIAGNGQLARFSSYFRRPRCLISVILGNR